MRELTIGRRTIGPGHPCYIVAEVSANHNHSLDRAIEIIRAAKAAGADAVKIQTYTAATITIDSNREWFQIPGDSLWAGKSLYDLYGEAYTPWEWQPRLAQVARDLAIDFFSTPFDETAVDFLETLNVIAHKVASFELVHLPLLRRVAATGKPVILSTGMASIGEIDDAVRTLRSGGAAGIALLKCTSAYPAPAAEMNLRTIPHLADTFDVPVGLSDHTLGHDVATAAVALGACIVEKHFTLRRSDGGPDSAFSMEPEEFAALVHGIRQVELALGHVSYERTPEELKSVCFRRSLFVVDDVRAGERFTAQNVRPIRPGYGLLPRYLEQVLGNRASRDVARGTPLSWDLVAGG